MSASTLCLVACVSTHTLAADLAPPPVAPADTGWLVTIGAGPQALRSFPGAGTYIAAPIGHFDYRRANEPESFYAPDDGFGVALLNLGWIKAGPVGGFVPRRGLSNGNGNFYGLHNVDLTIQGGGFVEIWLADFLRTRLELRQAFNGNHGLQGNVAIDAVERFGPATLSIGPRMVLGNGTFMNAYFSVTPFEAAANGRVTPFQASGGVMSVGGLASAKFDISRNWSVSIFGGYQRLVNSAAESPIPNKLGSLNAASAGGILAYSFDFKGLGILGF